jgi:hypothetical protein
MKHSIEVENFRPRRSNTLYGFVDILIPEMHLRIRELSVHEKNGQRWVGLPSRPQLTKDGSVRRDDQTGKVLYANILEITDRATRDAFSERTITALLAGFPEAFTDEAAS